MPESSRLVNPSSRSERNKKGLRGSLAMPGDKSLSHRALLLSSLALGRTRITGLLESTDVAATKHCLQELGVVIEREKDKSETQPAWLVYGVGSDGLQEPSRVLECGNSGTSARLLSGLLAARPFPCVLSGDSSLRARPMDRVMAHLAPYGVRAHMRAKRFLPMSLEGLSCPVLPLEARLQTASAQVKSALLLFALSGCGVSRIIEPTPSRDHSERMLRAMGAALCVEARREGRVITLDGRRALSPLEHLPLAGDISSAAFFILAATIVEGSDITLVDVGLNPSRDGFIETLLEMGADITVFDRHEKVGEPVGSLRVRSARLSGVVVPDSRAPRMIDEYPALAMAAACAEGRTLMQSVGELRVKECDRIRALGEGLARCGVESEQSHDSLAVFGAKSLRGGARINSYGDHRIAMSFLVLGLVSESSLSVEDGSSIATSFPDFAERMQSLGASIECRAAAEFAHIHAFA